MEAECAPWKVELRIHGGRVPTVAATALSTDKSWLARLGVAGQSLGNGLDRTFHEVNGVRYVNKRAQLSGGDPLPPSYLPPHFGPSFLLRPLLQPSLSGPQTP